MSERDELARIILSMDRMSAVSAILAAGFRKPWTITKAAERLLLQQGTICVDRGGNAWKRGTGSWVSTGGDTGPLYDEDDIELTVLHEGTQP